jgi:hypothetical protein
MANDDDVQPNKDIAKLLYDPPPDNWLIVK